MATGDPQLDVDVPEGESPTATCPYCDRPFVTERLHALHLGVAHEDRLSAAEREAYETAYAEETDDLFTFHVKITLAIMFVFFFFAYLYAFVLTNL